MADKGIPKIAAFINGSKTTQKILRGINRNPAVFAAVASFGFASVLRPAIIGCFNFNDKKDKKYSQASAVAAGLMELAATVALFIPLNKAIDKASRALYNTKGSFFEGNNMALRQFKSVSNRSIKLLALVPISMARFALIKPVVKLMFGEKESKELVAEKVPTKTDRGILKGRFEKWA